MTASASVTTTLPVNEERRSRSLMDLPPIHPAPYQRHRQSSLRDLAATMRQSVIRRFSRTGALPPKPTTERLNRISSTTSDEHQHIDNMIKQLSEDEIEIAARTSYEYFTIQDPSTRMEHAKNMAKRYFRSKKEESRALSYMKDTLKFRKRLDVDGLRTAFLQDSDDDGPVSDYRDPLQELVESKMVYVSGYDLDGRATYIFEPYRVQSHSAEWTIKHHVYTLERAIACTKSYDQTVNAVVNFNGFSAVKHAPPTSVGKEFMKTLRAHYIGHVNQIFLVDAPTTFLCLWTIFKPFVSVNTKNRIQFVSSERQKIKGIGKWYAVDQARPWMLPGGSKTRELDVEEYLYQTPFHQAFDE
jgi:hypothetical protein